MTHDVYKTSMLAELIERVSRKPYSELEEGRAYMRFSDDRYGDDYCEHDCPLEELRYMGIRAECPGGCRKYEEHIRDGQRKVYAADMVVGEILSKGYKVLGVEGINEPFSPDWDSGYACMDWESSYEPDSGICAGCVRFGTEECPEDILSESCPRSGNVWAVEYVAEALNEVIL